MVTTIALTSNIEPGVNCPEDAVKSVICEGDHHSVEAKNSVLYYSVIFNDCLKNEYYEVCLCETHLPHGRIKVYISLTDPDGFVSYKDLVNEGCFVEVQLYVMKRIMKNLSLTIRRSLRTQAQMGLGDFDPIGMKQLAATMGDMNLSAQDIIHLVENKADGMRSSIDCLSGSLGAVLNNLTPMVDQVVQSATNVAEKGVDINFSFSKLFDFLDDPATAVFSFALVYVFVEIIERKYEIPQIKYIKPIIGLFALLKLGAKAKEICVSWLSEWMKTSPQTDWSDWLMVVAQGALFLVAGTTINFESLTSSVKSLSSAAMNATKLSELFKTIVEWFKSVMTMISSSLGMEMFDFLKPQETKIKQLMEKVNQLNMIYIENPMGVDIKFSQEVTRLFMEINDYITTVDITSKSQPMQIALKGLQDKMYALKRNVADAGLDVGERNDPMFVVVAGAPGIGKTYSSDFLSSALAVDSCTTPEELIETQRNFKNKIYYWPFENKHHDQYRGQVGTVMPDLFAMTDAEGVVSEAVSLIYLVGGQNMQLPAAEVTKKQRLWFVSDFVLACTNVTYVPPTKFKSLNNADAVRRRLDEFGWYQYVNPKYIMRDSMGRPVVDAATNRIRGYEGVEELYAKLDPSKIPDTEDMPEDLWTFRRFSFAGNCFTDDKCYYFNAFVELCKAQNRKKKRDGEKKRSLLKNHATKLVQEKLFEIKTHPQDGLRPVPKYAPYRIDAAFKKQGPLKEDYKDPVRDEQKKKAREFRRDFLDIDRVQKLLRKDPPVLIMPDVPLLEMQVEPVSDEEYQATDRSVYEYMDSSDDEFQFALEEEEKEFDSDASTDNSLNEAIVDDLKVAFAAARTIPQMDADQVSKFLHERVDKELSRESTYWSSIKSYLSGRKMTEAQYLRIQGYMSEFSGYEFLASSPRPSLEAMTQAETGILLDVLAVIERMESDEEVGEIVKCLRFCDLMKFNVMPYAEAMSHLVEWRFFKFFKSKISASIHYSSYCLSEMVSNCCGGIMSCWINFSTWFGEIKNSTFVRGMSYIGQMAIAIPAGFVLGFAVTEWLLSIYRKSRPVVVKKKGQSAQATWFNQHNIRATVDKYLDNFSMLYVDIDGPDGKPGIFRHPCNVTFLGCRTAVTVDHFRRAAIAMREKMPVKDGWTITFVLVKFRGNDFKSSTERHSYDEVVFETSEELEKRDLCIMKFKHGVNRPNISKLIPPFKCLQWMMGEPDTPKKNIEAMFVQRRVSADDLSPRGPELRVPVWMNAGYIGYPAEIKMDNLSPPVKVDLGYYGYGGWDLKGRDDIFVTYGGGCASPCFITDERKNFAVNIRLEDGTTWKQAQQPWLAYLHTAITDLTPSGVPIYLELFTKWVDEMRVEIEPPMEVVEETLREYGRAAVEHLGLPKETMTQMDNLEMLSEISAIDSHHQSIAVMKHTFFEPRTTEIKRSKLWGLEKSTRFPTRFGIVTKRDGTKINVKINAMEPYGVNTASLNEGLISGICMQAMTRIFSMSSTPKNQQLLDFEQCIYGDGAFNLNSVNWSSSTGFNLRIVKDVFKTDWKSKKWMVDPTTSRLYPKVENYLRHMFNYCDARLKMGKRLYSVNVDCIKDELLSVEKLQNGQARLFCANDFVYLLLMKKYYGSFAGWIFENRVNNGIAIGINPLSRDWDAVAHHLLSNSHDVIFADHSKFDKHQLRLIMRCVLMLCDMYYNDKGSQDSIIRELLLEDVINSLHVTTLDGRLVFYFWEQGNTSGNFLTAILNSLINWCYLYICAILAWLVHQGIDPMLLPANVPNPADKALQAIVLGDDLTASIKKDVLPGVNFNTIRQAAERYLNIKITDELKTGGECPDFRKLTDGSFLGRGFHWEPGERRWIAPLREYSIRERVLWSKGETSPEIEVEKLESAFVEMSLHGKEKFDSYVRMYALHCKQVHGIYPNYTDYDSARKFALEISKYKYSFNDFVNGCDQEDQPSYAKLLKIMRAEVAAEAYRPIIKYERGGFEALLIEPRRLGLTLKSLGVKEGDPPPSKIR